MNKRAAAVVLGLACVAFGAAYVQAAGKLAKEPLWAYGFLTPPTRGDVWGRQAPPPGRTLRPNEDSEQQIRPRHVDGSPASFSLLDIRDGQNVIDWFPEDHAPMPDVIKHGPAALGPNKRGCGSCHLPNGKGRPENAGVAGLPRKDSHGHNDRPEPHQRQCHGCRRDAFRLASICCSVASPL